MGSHGAVQKRRRQQRIPLSVPIVLTLLKPGARFHMYCDTTNVSGQGAELRARQELPLGIRVRLDTPTRHVEAQIVRCVPEDSTRWRISVELLQPPANFWGVQTPPEDWDPFHHARSRRDEDAIWVG